MELSVDIEITQNFMAFEGREYTCSLVRDIRQGNYGRGIVTNSV